MAEAETSTALTSPADQQTLAWARQQNSRPQIVSFDSIKLKDSEKKVIGIDGNPLTRGSYYIESYDAATKQKTFREIGPDPDIVILHRCYTYSWYKEGEGLMAWTSDIQLLNEDGHVTLFAKKDGKVVIDFEGRYKPDFKEHMARHYVDAGKNLLKFQTLLYVFYEGKVYRMFVSNASAAGIEFGEKAPDFQNPQEGSLISFIDTTRGEEMDAALCEYVCRLGAVFRDEMEQPFYVRTFSNVGRTPADTLKAAVGELRKLMASFERPAEQHVTIHDEGGAIDVPVIPADVEAAEYPF